MSNQPWLQHLTAGETERLRTAEKVVAFSAACHHVYDWACNGQPLRDDFDKANNPETTIATLKEIARLRGALRDADRLLGEDMPCGEDGSLADRWEAWRTRARAVLGGDQ